MIKVNYENGIIEIQNENHKNIIKNIKDLEQLIKKIKKEIEEKEDEDSFKSNVFFLDLLSSVRNKMLDSQFSVI